MAGLEVVITTNRQDLKLPLISPWNLIPDLSIQKLGKVTIPSPSNTAEWGSNSPDDERLIPTFHWEDFKKKGLEKLRIKDHKAMLALEWQREIKYWLFSQYKKWGTLGEANNFQSSNRRERFPPIVCVTFLVTESYNVP